MLSYCFKRRKNTEYKSPKFVMSKNGKIMLLLKCAVCNIKNQNLLKNKKLVDY